MTEQEIHELLVSMGMATAPIWHENAPVWLRDKWQIGADITTSVQFHKDYLSHLEMLLLFYE